MTKGPDKKSKYRAIEEGTYREDRYGDDIANVMSYENEIVPPPQPLRGQGKKEWIRLMEIVGPINGYILPTDYKTLVLYCQTYEFWYIAQRDVKKNGQIIKVFENGLLVNIKINPSFRIYEKSTNLLIKLSSMLGFSPSDRTRINLQIHISKNIKKGFEAIPEGKGPIKVTANE